MPSPGDLSKPGLKPTSPALTGGFFTSVPLGKPLRLGPTFFIGLMSRNSNLSLAFMNIALESLDCFISLQSSHASSSSSSFFFFKSKKLTLKQTGNFVLLVVTTRVLLSSFTWKSSRIFYFWFFYLSYLHSAFMLFKSK